MAIDIVYRRSYIGVFYTDLLVGLIAEDIIVCYSNATRLKFSLIFASFHFIFFPKTSLTMFMHLRSHLALTQAFLCIKQIPVQNGWKLINLLNDFIYLIRVLRRTHFTDAAAASILVERNCDVPGRKQRPSDVQKKLIKFTVLGLDS